MCTYTPSFYPTLCATDFSANLFTLCAQMDCVMDVVQDKGAAEPSLLTVFDSLVPFVKALLEENERRESPLRVLLAHISLH